MAYCKSCGSEIAFKKVGGKWWPTAPDGGDHFDLCSKLRMDYMRNNGEHFSTKDKEGYRIGAVTKLTRISGKPIRGRHYKPHACTQAVDCGLPPWEPCACSTLDPGPIPTGALR